MKLFFTSFFATILSVQVSFAQNNGLDQSFLFDEGDIIVRAQESSSADNNKNNVSEEDINSAINQAKNLLNQQPARLPKIEIPEMKNIQTKKINATVAPEKLAEAPFGLFWGASQTATENQGVILQRTELKDYENSFLATSLPKPISFFNRVYVVFGKDDKLYRILSYSQFINDDSSAQKTLDEYNKYSQLLNKKYGNKQVFFTPAILEKTVKVGKDKEEIIKEKAPLGNPDFLNQLASGKAVLYSTYHNKDVATALSIGVDGEKKSYIVIDYRNLKIIQEQEAATLDAL